MIKQLLVVLACGLGLAFLTLAAWGWAKRTVVEEVRQEMRQQLEAEIDRLKEAAWQHRSDMAREAVLIEQRMSEELSLEPTTKVARALCRIRGGAPDQCERSYPGSAP